VIQIHTFIGISISKELTSVYGAVQEEYLLPKYYKNVVNKEDFHLTLLFLGSWQSEKRVKLWERLQRKVSLMPSFLINFTKLDYFGEISQPRVFYVGIEIEKRLIELQSLIKSEAEMVGFPKNNRVYHPHLTLAKKWRDMSEEKPKDWNLPATIGKRSQRVDQINLYQIHPSKESMYERISTIHLAGET